MKRIGLFIIITMGLSLASAQSRVADSIRLLLAKEKKDTSKVILLCNLSNVYYSFNPDSALIIGEEALFLAKKIKYTEGEAKSLANIANACLQIGNYPRALEFYLHWLQLEEKRNDPAKMARVFNNIGIVYVYQEEYSKALSYYYQSDSIMHIVPETDAAPDFELRYGLALNIGDLYNRINKLDSAYYYFQLSLAIASRRQHNDFMGTSMVGLGEVFLKKREFEQARIQFKTALPYLQEANNEDLMCEAYLGMANLYDSLGRLDSAGYYAQQVMFLARKDGFMNWQLKASIFLDVHYMQKKNIDSAYSYLVLSQALHDSIKSNEKARELQILSSNEHLRQLEIVEQKRKEKEERFQQLQLLGIGIFIPLFFLMTLLISRRRVNVRLVRLLGVISLLLVFEYLTLLLHPYVADITHHTPIYELLIFVCIAAVLIRAHHRIEEWFIDKLIHSKRRFADGHIPIRRIKIKMKRPPGESSPG